MRTSAPAPVQRKDSFPWNTLSRTSSFSTNAAPPPTAEEAMQTRKANSPPTFTADRVDRTSFSSVKETNTGIAQSFTDSKTSSYLRNVISAGGGDATNDEAVYEDSLSSGSITPLESDKDSGVELDVKFGRLTASRLRGFVCPCDGFRGWKAISVKGKLASKSYGDLQALRGWDWELQGAKEEIERARGIEGEIESGKDEAGNSPFERLPVELLGTIIDQLATDIPPNGYSARNIDLMSLLQTSRTLHAATLSTLYGHITIPHSRIFRKFLAHVSAYPSLGTIVRRIDFSHFNPTGAGMTARQRAETPNLTPQTLLECLNLVPNLQEFLAQEHIDNELSVEVLNALFEMPKIKALDFCACSSTTFRDAFTSALAGPLPMILPIARLSLHECTALPISVYTSLLPRLPQLTHLDVAHTRITDEALFAIPQTARLTHLNISRCAGLTGAGVVEFLTTHPAASGLISLNMASDVKSHELLTSEDITTVLPLLPTTLRSLNLKGSKMDASHVPFVLPLTKHVEEIGLGRHLKLKDLVRLFLPAAPIDTPPEELEEAEIQAQLSWIPHTLRYIDVSDLNSTELDLSSLFASSCPLLTSSSHPLEVLELSSEVYKKLDNSPSSLKRVGWCVKEAGRRGWLVRVTTPKDGEKVDNGGRSWKWGAQFWGGRKIPVARAEVGGMYGHYMFKR